jgi:two-component system LytT family response regulator
MLRTIVVDDEKLSREVLCNYLIEYCHDIEIVSTASSVKFAYKAIKKFNPDFIFLDIEMADGKGFDLLTMFDQINFKVIFVTAYSEYAVKAFRYSAVDYLLKPLKIDELKDAVEKVRALNGNGSGTIDLAALLNNLRAGSGNISTLVIPHVKGFEVLKLNEIIMCQAEGYCTNFYLTGNRKISSSRNLKHFADLLEDSNFIRVHHSYIVNINHVSSFSRQGEIFLAEKNKASLSDSFKTEFLGKLGKK